MITSIEEARAIINEHIKDTDSVIGSDNKAPTDIATLKDHAIGIDLKNTVEQLAKIAEMSSLEEMRNHFAALCKQRDADNTGSSVSLAVAPNNRVNQIIWSIGCKLFNIKSQLDAFKLFAPSIKHQVVFNLELRDVQLRGDDPSNIKYKPTLVPVESVMKDEISLERFGSYIFVGDYVFKLEDIGKMPLEYLQTLFAELGSTKQFRELEEAIFVHNDAFRQLKVDLDLINDRAQTPRQALEVFATKLKLGSSAIHGGANASITAAVAFTELNEYLCKFPSSLREQLLELSDEAGKSLKSVIDDLNRENCVALASKQIFAILKENPRAAILNSSPFIDKDKLKETKDKYGANGYGLPLHADEATKKLPKHLLSAGISAIKIDNEEQMIDVLVNFDPSQFNDLFMYSEINANIWTNGVLSDQIRAGLLDTEGKTAFASAIIQNREKFGSLWLYILADCNLLTKELLDSVSDDELLEVLSEKDRVGATALHRSVHDTEMFKLILSRLSDDLLDTQFDTPAKIYLLLECAIENPTTLKLVIDTLKSKGMMPEALYAENYAGKNSLHNAAVMNHESLEILLDEIPEDNLLQAVTVSNYGKSPLQMAASANCAAMKCFLTRLEHIGVNVAELVTQPSGPNNSTVFLESAENTQSLNHLMQVVPESDIIEAMLHRFTFSGSGGIGSNSLFAAMSRQKDFRMLLEKVPVERRFDVVTDNSSRDILFFSAARHPESFMIILDLVPQDRYAELFKFRNKSGNTIWHNLVTNAESLRKIVEKIDHKLIQKILGLTNMPIKLRGGGTQTVRVVDKAVEDAESLQLLFANLADKQKMDLAESICWTGDSLLQRAIDINRNSFNYLFSLYRDPQERIRVIGTANGNSGDTLLHSSARRDPDIFSLLLQHYPGTEDKKRALLLPNKHGQSVFSMTARIPECFEMACNYFSNEELAEHILKDTTVLQDAAQDYDISPGKLQFILSKLLSVDEYDRFFRERTKAVNMTVVTYDGGYTGSTVDVEELRLYLSNLVGERGYGHSVQESYLPSHSQSTAHSGPSPNVPR